MMLKEQVAKDKINSKMSFNKNFKKCASRLTQEN